MKKLARQSRLRVNLFFVIAGILPLFAVSLFAAPAQTRLEGYVEALDVDDNENPISIGMTMETEDGDIEYVIFEKKGKGVELFNLVGEYVRVTGTMGTPADGEKRMQVTAFSVVVDPDME